MAHRRRSKLADKGWAAITPPHSKNIGKEGLSVVDEEAYLRTRSYHALSRRMDEVWADVLQALGGAPVQDELSKLLDLGEDDHGSQSSVAEESRSEGTSGEQPLAEQSTNTPSPMVIEPPRRYDPLLLPLLLLDGPYHRLDRHEWMKHLVSETKKSRSRSCVTWLRESTGLPISFQQELTRQCLIQEEDLSSLRLKGKRRTSFTEILVSWASRTSQFDNIVVFLEIDDGFMKSSIQDFVQWLADCRAQEGLPLVLVLMGPHVGRLSMQVRAATQGPVGLLVLHIRLPSSVEVFDAFSDQLLNTSAFPLVFSATVLESIRQRFREENRSAVCAILDLKQATAFFHLAPGSFLTTSRLLRDEEIRIAWFMRNTGAREIAQGNLDSRQDVASWISQVESAREACCVSFQVAKAILCGNETETPHLLQSIDASSPSPNSDGGVKTTALSLLVKLRKQQHGGIGPSRKASPDEEEPRRVLDLINRLIVLADQCAFPNDFRYALQPPLDNWKQFVSRHHNIHQNETRFLDSLMSQPRRQTVHGLVENIGIDPGVLEELLGCLYRHMLRERVTISQSEWFELFVEEFTGRIACKDPFLLFSCGVCHLIIAGLIRERRAVGKGERLYEKTAFVWCSDT